MRPVGAANLGLCLGVGSDAQRSPDEIRIIKEMLAAEIENFAYENRVDARAARELMAEPPYIQLSVLDRGALKNCNNPSGAFVARIRDARRQPPPQPAPPNAAAGGLAALHPNGAALSELDRFIAENRLDQGAAHCLRAEPPEMQQKVLAMGPFGNVPNPSAMLMIRLRSVQAAANGQAPCAGAVGASGLAPLMDDPDRASTRPRHEAAETADAQGIGDARGGGGCSAISGDIDEASKPKRQALLAPAVANIEDRNPNVGAGVHDEAQKAAQVIHANREYDALEGMAASAAFGVVAVGHSVFP
eukprot:CAMPEP_0117513418 /NCGR_PEP_ID=MMETSP0784-20121206/29543_1 /TAXON_ID=39447 /ORGANISM="" /LENGTH=302 /DNA_ID=CAMNT_0005309181 /DNA_START=42 /DNA_END=948 /DNA_ORIENTATION=+